MMKSRRLRNKKKMKIRMLSTLEVSVKRVQYMEPMKVEKVEKENELYLNKLQKSTEYHK